MSGYIIPLLFFIVVALVVIMKRTGASIPNPHLGTKLKNMNWGWVKNLKDEKWAWAAGLVILVHLMLLLFANTIYLAIVGQMWIWALSVAGIILLAIADKSGKMVKAARIVLVSVVLISVASGFVSGDIPLPDFGKDGQNENVANVTPTNGPAVIVGQPAKLEFDPADSIPTDVARLIEEKFSGEHDTVATVMKRIAWAESRGHHWQNTATDSVPTRNENPGKAPDIGLFQIHEGGTHQDCLDQGFYYTTLEGNLDCAYFLYKRSGYTDWRYSAWSWRDFYVREPEDWSFDRTPEQIVAASRGQDEIVIITAPVGTFGARAHTYNRKMCFVGVGEAQPYLARDDEGNTYEIGPDTWAKMTRVPKYLEFQSLSGDPQAIVVTRKAPGGKCK